MDLIESIKTLVKNIKALLQSNQDNAPLPSIESLMISAAGEISIAVSRATANIAIPLPFIIFGSNDFKSSYATLLQESLKIIRNNPLYGLLTLVISVSASGNVLFTYTNGAQQDIITVSYVGNLQSYSAYLAAMNNDFFSSSLIMYQISDTGNGAAQLNNVIQFSSSSSLSLAEQNEVPIQSCVKPFDNPTNGRVALVFDNQRVTPDIGILDTILPLAAFVVTYHTYMSKRFDMSHILDKKIAKSVYELDHPKVHEQEA